MPRGRQSTVVKARNANMMQKVEGAQQTCHGSSYNHGRQNIKACERSEQCNKPEGRCDSGNNASKRSKVTQPKPDTPQKCGRQKTLGWTSLRRPKWAAARALHLKMQMYYPLRWLHRSRVVLQETAERAGYLLEMQKQNRKSTKEERVP